MKLSNLSVCRERPIKSLLIFFLLLSAYARYTISFICNEHLLRIIEKKIIASTSFILNPHNRFCERITLQIFAESLKRLANNNVPFCVRLLFR